MFCKLHRQMTIFSTLVTSGILILMTITCLIISEQGLVRNSYERFWNNGNSCVAYLENQNVSVTHQWILESRQEYGVEISILDNGRKLYFEKLGSGKCVKKPEAIHRTCWKQPQEFQKKNRD